VHRVERGEILLSATRRTENVRKKKPGRSARNDGRWLYGTAEAVP